MYMLYIDHVLFPVAPGKIVIENEVNNRAISLVDGSFMSLRGSKGLKKISFELLLPMTEYPFAQYEGGFKDAGYFMDELERIATENKPVWFDVYRTFPDMNKTYLTNIQVLVEKISITEDAENGMDMKANVVLREYRNVQTRIVNEKQKEGYGKRDSDFEVPDTYTVKSGDSLWYIAKKFLDDSTMYTYLAQINSIEYPYTIYVGQTIKLRE